MSKKKRPEQQPADFSNTPFKSLKGYAARTAQKPAESRPARKKAEPAGDEGELFLQAAAGARKLHDAAPDAPESAAPAEKDRASAGDRDAFLQAMRKMGGFKKSEERPEEDFPSRTNRSQSGRMKQLKRGTLRISGEIDLHGCLRDEALARLGQFIAAAYAQSRDAVLVITGKGINSPEGPVLQGVVAEWLRTKGKGMVAEFSPAPRDKGGSGAFVVFLRKK